ncbi:hypothetical protein [Nonomuraea sp. NPDC049758]|uniref:hypothetical protein n=1 Tax=Nonomuraea sp. NPDC049758 TaxID=3154360 RepID=UPI00341AA3E8
MNPTTDPATDATAGLAQTDDCIVLVDNTGGDAAASRHINTLDRPGGGCAVVRPTPGADDVETLGLDLLVAAGKHPHAARRERVVMHTWPIAASWLAGQAVTDLIVDRAHRLTGDQLKALARTAAHLEATLWLLWAAPADPGIALVRQALGRPAKVVSLWEFHRRLPAPQQPLPPGPAEPEAWPALPSADFPTFLAACRRRLHPADFPMVKNAFHDAAEATDTWLDTLDLTPTETARLTTAVTGWLRDHTVGCAPAPRAALVRLRAVQAALFLSGIHLSWRPDALGPNPARRLLGDLTGRISAHLHATCRTDAASATALALHLNHAGTHMAALALADIAPDGSAVRGPTSAPRLRDAAWHEFSGPEPIRIPQHARPLLAAHLAHRRDQGAAEAEPYFLHPRDPGRDPHDVLRAAIHRTCHRLGLDPPWLHGDDCRYGADIGLTARRPSWMSERGLRVAWITGHDELHIPRPAPPSLLRNDRINPATAAP